MKLTRRDRDILQTLALRVRIFTLEQLAHVWWKPTKVGRDTARRRLYLLKAEGLLSQVQVMARPLPPIEAPVIAWSRTAPKPDFGHSSWLLQSRWKEPPAQTTLYLLSNRAANIYGAPSRDRLRLSLQATHDLGLAEVYCRYREKNPAAAKTWLGEDLIEKKSRRDKIPDAVLLDTASGKASTKMVIEFGGAYSKARLLAFHRYFSRRGLPYEIW